MPYSAETQCSDAIEQIARMLGLLVDLDEPEQALVAAVERVIGEMIEPIATEREDGHERDYSIDTLCSQAIKRIARRLGLPVGRNDAPALISAVEQAVGELMDQKKHKRVPASDAYAGA